MNIYKEARAIALECLVFAKQAGEDFDQALDYIHADCEGHEVAIYYGKAIDFCATQDTSAGEEWLEDVGGIAQPGDTFGNIACRIAFATLYVAAQEALEELRKEAEDAEAEAEYAEAKAEEARA